MICCDFHTYYSSVKRLSKFAQLINNFLVIWDKVALNESHRLTQNTRNTVLLDTEYFENGIPKLLSGLLN